ncbi:MAG: hotdog fold thioesterase [Methanoregulaceae archaeon]|nr:hotdog fold thioesterase [Methanoregulaceae archaeon]
MRETDLPAGEKEERIAAFNGSEYARLLGMEIVQTWDGGARVVMDTKGKHNSNGVAHGGAVFSLADHAFGIAANLTGIHQVAVSAYVTYLAPSTGRLEAVAEKVSENGEHSLYRVVVYEGSRVVALFDGTGIKVTGPKKV